MRLPSGMLMQDAMGTLKREKNLGELINAAAASYDASSHVLNPAAPAAKATGALHPALLLLHALLRRLPSRPAPWSGSACTAQERAWASAQSPLLSICTGPASVPADREPLM